MNGRVSLALLALLMFACALLEGLLQTPPGQFVQLNGLLIILCADAFAAWSVKRWLNR